MKTLRIFGVASIAIFKCCVSSAFAQPNPDVLSDQLKNAIADPSSTYLQGLAVPICPGGIKLTKLLSENSRVYLAGADGIRFVLSDAKWPDIAQIMNAKSLGQLLEVLAVSQGKDGEWKAIDEGNPKAYFESLRKEGLFQIFRIAYVSTSKIALFTIQAQFEKAKSSDLIENKPIASIAVDVKSLQLNPGPQLLTSDILGEFNKK